MTLRDDLRGHFAREEAHFPAPSGLRDSVVAGAVDSEPAQRRQLTLAAVVAVVLAAAIVAGLLAGGALRHNQVAPAISPKPTKPTAPPTVPVPSQLEIDAIDASTAFAYYWTPPASGGTEMFWFTRTTDGGAHWSTPVRIGVLPPGEGDSGHHIHFIDQANGIFYGGPTISVTHDGGRTWHDSGLQVLETVAASGRAPWLWAVTYPCPKPTDPSIPVCAYRVYLSKDGARTWGRSWDLPAGFEPRYAVAFGEGGLVVTKNATGDMYMTGDGGLDWSTIRGRCAGGTSAAYTATADGRELWQLCTNSFPDFTPKALYVSEDGGGHWMKRSQPHGGALSELYSAAKGTAFLLSAQTPVQVTRDGGRTWSAARSADTFNQIVFTSATDAWAVGDDGSAWTSRDGGRTWSKTPAQPRR